MIRHISSNSMSQGRTTTTPTNTATGVNPFLLPYTPGTANTQGSSAGVGASPGDLPTGSTAVSRKDQLEFWLTKLRAEVDSLDQDGWIFEAPRHRQR